MAASNRNSSQKNPKVLIALVAAAILLAVIVLSRILGDSGKEAEIREGIAYLETLEKGDTSEIETAIVEQRRKRMNEERELRLTQLTNGTIDVWSLFGDSVILGDSRTVGFTFYEFLPEERVLAATGDSISNIEDHIEELKTLNPSLIFVCYGMNDIGMWADIDDFADHYREYLDNLQKELPNAQVFINSIFPVQNGVEGWDDIPEYNSAIRSMCEAEGYGYVDGDEVIGDHGSLYDVDGIHFMMDFYPYWAAQMMMTVYDTQTGAGQDAEEGYGGENTDYAASSDEGEANISEGADGE